MDKRIEDYAFISNMRTGAIVSRDGSIDWLCVPRFDSGACCAALLGKRENGYWSVSPTSSPESITRSYRGNTMVLETLYRTAEGEVALIDFVALAGEREDVVNVVRIVEGRSGRVPMRMSAKLRFDYGRVKPSSRCEKYGGRMVAGPDALQLHAPMELKLEDDTFGADFEIDDGERVALVLCRGDSWRDAPEPVDAQEALEQAEEFWGEWSSRYTATHPWRDAALRSLLTLKALTDDRTGGVVGAATMGLPEIPGGQKNYDYRYTWVRDATFTVYAMTRSGYLDEARMWRDWLMRTAAHDPEHLQPVYTVDGGQRISQETIDHLDGYRDSRPVLVGNHAWAQTQMDGYGELINGVHVAHEQGVSMHQEDFDAQVRVVEYLETHWQKSGTGIWELGHTIASYTHSQVMAWAAVNRVAGLIENSTFEGDAERWRALADRIHAHVCENGFDKKRNTFLQRYGSNALDAAVLRIPLVGFLPASDPRMLGTIEAVQQELCVDGFIWRYSDDHGNLPGEGSFLVCSFWMVENLALLGRMEEAKKLFERLLGVCNEVGLLSEQYDPASKQLWGNFPQAFSHVGLINAAHRLAEAG